MSEGLATEPASVGMPNALENELSEVSGLMSSSAVRKPPPEPADQTRVRSLVIASFWAIVIFLGLPVWWWTTSIHRSRLPLTEMLEWADGKVR